MSSHREAPQISKDPTADSTDVYAFVSPDQPNTVTLIANYIPLQLPDGGPNFYEFADDVLYSINIDNDGDGLVDISFQFQFTTTNALPGVFLYNAGPITSVTGPGAANWNRRQTYALTRIDYTRHPGSTRSRTQTTPLGSGLPVPPCNIGPLSTPNYAGLASQAITGVGSGMKAFAGQRAEGFYVDLGSVFDLGNLRPFQTAHAGAATAGLLANMPGVNSTANVNVHTLALQVPTTQLTGSGPTIGVWTSAARQKVRVVDGNAQTGAQTASGPYTQVSRLGNPLVNELLIGIGDKDYWNAVDPTYDGGSRLLPYFQNPLLGQLLPTLYPGAFPNLANYYKGATSTPVRPDLVAILLTGLPSGIVPGFSNTINSSPTPSDMVRLNTSIAPATNPNSLGVIGGDLAGFPNGRRVFDDVATIELRAVAGVTLPLVTKYTPDAVAGEVDFGLTTKEPTDGTDLTAKGTESYLSSFPYLGTPYGGYQTPATTPTSKSS